MKYFSYIILLISLLAAPVASHANPTKEFITSCTYGVLTGTLVGVASLAFTDQPGDNLQNVARGASLGLYLGIALGVYVAYVVPGQDEGEFDPENLGQGSVQVLPLITTSGVEGLYAKWNVLSF